MHYSYICTYSVLVKVINGVLFHVNTYLQRLFGWGVPATEINTWVHPVQMYFCPDFRPELLGLVWSITKCLSTFICASNLLMVLALNIFLIFFNSAHLWDSFVLLLTHIILKSLSSAPYARDCVLFHSNVGLPGISCPLPWDMFTAHSFHSFKSSFKNYVSCQFSVGP